MELTSQETQSSWKVIPEGHVTIRLFVTADINALSSICVLSV